MSPALLAGSLDIKAIANSSEWKALLYYQNDSFIISDPKFFISHERTLEAELEAFVRGISQDNKQEIICRFPARFFYLAGILNYSEDMLNRCDNLKDFQRRAPMERAYVMFASENISIPSSMMGHIYLKLTGKNHKKEEVEHAISFYTDVDGVNFPKLVIESLLLGKKGYYALTPAEPIKNKYILLEGRNVWEYELNLTNDQRKLLHYHLYELRGIKLTYFFHTFNCATLIKQIHSVANPPAKTPKSEWTTPLDVIRYIYKNDLIASQAVTLSKKWKIKSLIDSSDIDKKTIQIIKKNNLKKTLKHIENREKNYGFKSLELSKAYNNFLFEKGSISEDESVANLEDLNKYSEKKFSDMGLDFSGYKNPIRTKSTAQVMANFSRENNESIYKMTWLPASHFLEDDSSNYLSESELQVSRLTIGFNESKSEFFLDEFNIYSSTSFQPSDILTGGLSGKFRIGYLNYFNSELDRSKSVIVEGSIGKSYRVHNDIDTFFLLGLNYLEANNVMFSPDIETGVILRAVLNMKTIISINYMSEDIQKGKSLINYQLKHFIDLKSYGLLFESSNIQNQNADFIHNYSVGIKKYF